jgi:hypothetical protein
LPLDIGALVVYQIRMKCSYTRFSFVIAILCFLTTISARAAAPRPLAPDDPKARAQIATEQYSPLPPMYVSSYLGFMASIVYFAPTKNSVDNGRDQMDLVNGIAVGVLAVGGSLNYILALASSSSMSDADRLTLGDVFSHEIDVDKMRFKRNMFLAFHGLNTLAVGIEASQSLKDQRWTVFGIQAVLPFLVDLFARNIVKSKAVSPWTFSATTVAEQGHAAPLLTLNLVW